MMSNADDFTLLASFPSIVDGEARANQLMVILMRCADEKQLAIAPYKSSVTMTKQNPVLAPPSNANL